MVGYAGLWMMVDEAHVTTFAVHPDWRRQGIGRRLPLALLVVAEELHAARMTLEVRVSEHGSAGPVCRAWLHHRWPPGALLHRRR